jgi:Protein of unknown function (DUF3048) N-terminal domain/Protein of unknown function (DUF3048) C-terminal domain
MLKSDSLTVFFRLVVPTAALSLVLAGCGGGDEEESSDENSRDSGTLTQVSPLTGLEAADGLPDHPVVVVKVDNTSSAEPQVGLGSADLVVEELVEGGSTRLAAFFWTQTPGEVGPVRSMRSTDVGIVSPADGVLVASGGAPPAIRDIKDAGIETFTEGATGYSRDSGRVAPYDLMMNLEELVGELKAADAPGPYIPYGGPDATIAGEPATKVDVEFSGGQTTKWSYEEGTGWIRKGSLAEQGDDFVPDNLLALDVKVGDAGYLDPAGNPVPESDFFGQGSAVLFSDGKALRCEWAKDGADGQLELTQPDGTPVDVPPGRTWIELVPKNGGSVKYQRG